MKRTPLLITLGILLLVVGGFFVHERFFNQERVSPWTLVPQDAILVYERGNCQDCIGEFTSSTIWKIIERAIHYQKPSDSLRQHLHDLLTPGSGQLISLHVTKKDDFDVVYYLPGPALIPADLADNAHRIETRELNGIAITELSHANETLSLTNIGGVWVASFVPFLLEDVIRTYTDPQRNGFRELYTQTPSLATIRDDAGNVHVQLKRLSDLIGSFTGPFSTLALPLGRSAILDVKARPASLVLNGFSVDTTAGRSGFLLSVFDHQSPVSFGLKHLVSNRTLAMKTFGVTDGPAFAGALERYLSRHRRTGRDTLVQLASAPEKIDELVATIGDEFGICFVESSRGNDLSRVLLVEATAPERWLEMMNQLSDRFSVDTVFHERYSDYLIREVPVYRFPEKLLWPFVTGFDQTFYTSVGSTILIGDNLEDLKVFLDDIDTEETWSKSVSVNRFLESTLLESNVSLYVNGSAIWNALLPHLQPKWQHFVGENGRLLRAMEMCSFQFSHLNNNYYTNLSLTFQPFDLSLTPQGKDRVLVNFDDGLQRLHVVKSHVNRSNEILIQDSLNDLSLLSAEGKALWKMPVGDKIVSEVTQVDFYDNGKLQYFFATRDAFHLIDRLGNYVESYPIRLEGIQVDHVSVIDYDNSRNYRFMVADERGRMWMFDKHGKNLEGWQPKDGGGKMAMPPRHHRIKGRDFIVAIRADGNVLVMNRRGETLKGFPLNTGAIPSGDYFLEIGPSIAESWFVFISEDGYRVRFNTEGKALSKEALVRTSPLSLFSLVREKSNKSYLVLQQDGRQLLVTDASGKRLFSAALTNINPGDVSFTDFGAGRRFIVISDVRQQMCYAYDGAGKMLTVPPVEGHAIDIRPVNSDEFQLFFIHGKTLTIQPL